MEPESCDPLFQLWRAGSEDTAAHGWSMNRLRALGAGVVLDDHQVFKAASSAAVWGDDALASTPPLRDMAAEGIPLAAGTDASRASSHSPWLSLWWLVAGTSLEGGGCAVVATGI